MRFNPIKLTYMALLAWIAGAMILIGLKSKIPKSFYDKYQELDKYIFKPK